MKNISYMIKSVILTGVMVLSASCNDKPVETIKPNFPESIDFLKNAGETVELSIEPNMAWELSIDAPVTEFWFEKAGVKRSTLTGSEGSNTVTIHITEEVSLDEDYTCTVSMTMGEETRPVATIKVAAGELHFKIYPAIWDDEAGDWKYDENGLVYSSEAKTGISLAFKEEDMNFECPAKVEANFGWSVPATEAAWLEPVGEQKEGIVEVVFTAKDTAYPDGGASDVVLNVTRKNGNPAEDNITLTASIPDYRNICIPMGDWESSFIYGNAGNFDGDYESESIDTYYFFAAEGAEVAVAKFASGTWDDYVEWLECEKLPATGEDSSKKIREQGFKLIVRPNSYGPARSAYILVKTADKAGSNFFTSDWTSLAEGVYCYTIEQDGADGLMGGPLAEVSGGIDALKEMTFELLPKSSNKWFYENFGTDHVYRLTSSKTTAEISFEYIPASYTYEIISSDNATAEQSVKTDWWIKYTAPKSDADKLTIKLDPVSGNSWTEAEKDKYASNQADGFSQTSLRYEGAYLLIKNGGKVMAAVDCIYDPTAVPVTDGLVDFAGTKPASSYVNKITIGDLSASLQEAISGAALYTTTARPISDPLNTSYPVYKVKVPKSAESVTIKVLNEPNSGYFIPEKPAPDWVTSSAFDDGQVTFTFSDSNAHEIVYTAMQSGLCVALITIVKE